jgi:hypothetical protein
MAEEQSRICGGIAFTAQTVRSIFQMFYRSDLCGEYLPDPLYATEVT